jgi:hypothetical protein
MNLGSPGPVRNGRIPGWATSAPTIHPAGREAGTDQRPTGQDDQQITLVAMHPRQCLLLFSELGCPHAVASKGETIAALRWLTSLASLCVDARIVASRNCG